jgi:hypothetical protein
MTPHAGKSDGAEDLTACILDRPRHQEELVRRVRAGRTANQVPRRRRCARVRRRTAMASTPRRLGYCTKGRSCR